MHISVWLFKPFVYSCLTNYFQFEKIKGNLFNIHSIVIANKPLWNFFQFLRNKIEFPQLWWAVFIYTVFLKSTYELWILFDSKQYVTACMLHDNVHISIWLVMIDTCIFKELVLMLGNIRKKKIDNFLIITIRWQMCIINYWYLFVIVQYSLHVNSNRKTFKVQLSWILLSVLKCLERVRCSRIDNDDSEEANPSHKLH